MSKTFVAPDIGYNIEDKDIEKARAVTVQCNGKRFRIFLEIVTSCFGNCSGCSLSYVDRKSTEPEMSIEQIQKTLSYFVPIVNNKKEIRTTIVNLGTGDYFMMSDDFLTQLSKTIRVFFDSVKTPRNVLTVSTSLFLSEEKMLSKIQAFKTHLHETQFAIDSVIDPLLLEQHYERYKNNYRSLIKYFPFFDLVVNISDGIEEKHIQKTLDLLKELGILNFDLQYAINNTNTYRVKTSRENFNSILNNIYSELGDKAKNVMELGISLPEHKKSDDDNTIFDEIKGQAREIVKERVMVKKDGNIYPLAFAFGDVILDERYDFSPIGNINEEFNQTLAEEKIFNHLKSIFIKNKKCHTCEFNKSCYSTGYSFYNTFDSSVLECQNVGRYIFENRHSDIKKY